MYIQYLVYGRAEGDVLIVLLYSLNMQSVFDGAERLIPCYFIFPLGFPEFVEGNIFVTCVSDPFFHNPIYYSVEAFEGSYVMASCIVVCKIGRGSIRIVASVRPWRGCWGAKVRGNRDSRWWAGRACFRMIRSFHSCGKMLDRADRCYRWFNSMMLSSNDAILREWALIDGGRKKKKIDDGL